MTTLLAAQGAGGVATIIGHDSQSVKRVTSTGSGSFTHTPVGRVRGVIVLVTERGSSADLLTSITYGGVVMTRIRYEADITGAVDVGATYIYHLGSNIPQG